VLLLSLGRESDLYALTVCVAVYRDMLGSMRGSVYPSLSSLSVSSSMILDDAYQGFS